MQNSYFWEQFSWIFEELLPSPIQRRKFFEHDNEELMEGPRPGVILREMAKMAVSPLLSEYYIRVLI